MGAIVLPAEFLGDCGLLAGIVTTLDSWELVLPSLLRCHGVDEGE